MMSRQKALLLLLAIPAFASAAGAPRRRNSAVFTSTSAGAFFPLSWGDDLVRSREQHCRSAPDLWVAQCRLNAQLVDRLNVRLQGVDWEELGLRADRRLEQIKRCLRGRTVADADGCYEEPNSNIVSGRYLDQYGGRWKVEAARGIPSEGLLDGPLWANAIIEDLGPVRFEVDEKGSLLSVSPPRARLAEAIHVEASIEQGIKNLSK